MSKKQTTQIANVIKRILITLVSIYLMIELVFVIDYFLNEEENKSMIEDVFIYPAKAHWYDATILGMCVRIIQGYPKTIDTKDSK